MATYTKRGKKVTVQVRLKGHYESQTFDSMGAARAWAVPLEADILAGARGEIPDKVFGAALARYRDEVSPTKKGAKWEIIRIEALLRDPIALVKFADFDSSHVASWRDRRLKLVKPASVRREWNLLSSICSVAIGEWKWLRMNPFSKAAGAKRPKNSKHRKEIILPADLAALEAKAAELGTAPARRMLRLAKFGIETAMRSSELIALGENPAAVCTTTRVAHLADSKNGHARDVPLSAEAVRLWEEAGNDTGESANRWGFTDASRDTQWRELRNAAAELHPPVVRLHFHDTRHTAITRLAKKLQILDLARMTGHTDLKELMTYYNESAADIARRL